MAKTRSKSVFDILQREVAENVLAPLLSDKDLSAMTRVCFNTSSLFKPILHKRLGHHVIFGNPTAVQGILNADPNLLLKLFTVIAPSGDTVSGTPYELALLAGDHDLAATIGGYFSKLKGVDGEAIRLDQNGKCKPYIDAMKDQKPDFDFDALLKVIMEASAEDVQDALGNEHGVKFQRDSELNKELAKLRKHFAPCVIKSGMHFNYANLLTAFTIYADQFDNLYRASGNFNKCDLFFRQIIGYIQRGLPACDRQAFAQGLYSIVDRREKLLRSFKFKHGAGDFPHSFDGSHVGLGFDFAAPNGAGQNRQPMARGGRDAVGRFGKLMPSKNIKLAELMQSNRVCSRLGA